MVLRIPLGQLSSEQGQRKQQNQEPEELQLYLTDSNSFDNTHLLVWLSTQTTFVLQQGSSDIKISEMKLRYKLVDINLLWDKAPNLARILFNLLFYGIHLKYNVYTFKLL